MDEYYEYYKIYRTMGYDRDMASKMAKKTAARLDGISGRDKMRTMIDGE